MDLNNQKMKNHPPSTWGAFQVKLIHKYFRAKLIIKETEIGKINEQIRPIKKESALLVKTVSPTPSNTGSTRSLQRH